MPKPCHVSLLDSGIQVLRSHASAAKVKHVDGVAGKERNIGRTLQCVGDVMSGFKLSHGDETGARLSNGFSNESCSFGFTLSTQHSCLSLFLTFEDNEFGALGSLLCDLFRLNSLGEIT